MNVTLTVEQSGLRADQYLAGVLDGLTRSAAQKLLETTELSISAVAEQTGFASAAHFRRVFHEVMGTGPLQYRKAHKK